MLYTKATFLALFAAPAHAWTAGSVPSGAAVRTSQPVMRDYLIAGNWKMNTVLDEAKSLAKEASDAASDVGVAVCVPFPFLVPVGDVLKDSSVAVGAQDCYYEASGAYAAAVS